MMPNASPPLRRGHVLGPVTAISLATKSTGALFILVGEDTWLKVYNAESSCLIGQVNIFESQAIHGIHVSGASGASPDRDVIALELLVWGGDRVTILSSASFHNLVAGRHVAQAAEVQVADRIYDGSLSPFSTDCGALVTAHNEVIPFSAEAGGRGIRAGPTTSPTRPILYSAKLSWLAANRILVAGGTAFGEIIVWEYFADVQASHFLFVFTGHEGSVFGLDISPELKLESGARLRLLASCSDDRTVRVWDMSRPPDAVDNDGRSSVQVRETGFGEDVGLSSRQKSDAARCLAVAMGHMSRIWHVRFSPRIDDCLPGSGPMRLFSFGEDATRQSWDLSIDPDRWTSCSKSAMNDGRQYGAGTVKHCGSISCHSGKNIWSVAITQDEHSRPVIATGGADGKVTLSVDTAPRRAVSQQEILGDDAADAADATYVDMDEWLSLDEMLRSVRPVGDAGSPKFVLGESKKTGQEMLKRYVFLCENKLLIVTSHGRLVLGIFGQRIAWEEVPLSESIRDDLRATSVLKCPATGTALIGGASGRLYMFQEHVGAKEIASLPGKITDLLCLSSDASATASATMVAAGLGLRCATLLTVDLSHGRLSDTREMATQTGTIITSAASMGKYLVLGTRTGKISLYCRGADGSLVPAVSSRSCLTKDAITDIIPLPDSSHAFLTCCRDGRYRIYAIKHTASHSSLALQDEMLTPVPLVEGARFLECADGSMDLIIHGFRRNEFVVWNQTQRQEIASVDCGGGLRPFAFISSPRQAHRFRFVTTKALQTRPGSTLRIFSQRESASRTVKGGGHGREIRALTRSGDYLATGGEDTTIRIWEYEDSPHPTARRFRCVAALERHVSGIQCLRWHEQDYLLSSGGNEELYIWRLTRIGRCLRVAVLCEAVFPHKTADGDLRILDLDVASQGGEKERMVITSIFSNSTLKSYVYSKEAGFELLSAGMYTGACLLQVRHVRTTSQELHVLTAATDGHISLWACSEKNDRTGFSAYTLTLTAKLHQNGIKSIDMVRHAAATGARWLVVTGGDDNALGLVQLAYDSRTGRYTIVKRSKIKDAHAAAITGLCVLQHDGASAEVASVSNDQRMKLWHVETGVGGEVRVGLVSNQHSAVADPAGLETIAPGRFVVGGVGMEVWNYREEEFGPSIGSNPSSF